MKKLLILIVCGFPLFVTGCSQIIPSYKIDIQQGNILTAREVNQLKLGMSQRQVSFLLGTPPIQDPFHQQRWDYVYTFQKGGGKLEKTNLTLHFENDKLVKWEGSMTPDPAAGQDASEYQKQSVVTVHPKPQPERSWWQRIWDSFFSSEDKDLYLD